MRLLKATWRESVTELRQWAPTASSRLPSSCPTFIHGLGDIVSPTEQRTQYGAIYDDHSPQRSSTGLSPQVTFSLEYAIKSNDIEGHETVRVKEEDMPVFSYFIDQCGPWLDIVSPDRRIAQSVSRLALKCSVLYYACLAYAARILHLHGRMDLDRSESYQSQAIRHLIPSLDPSKSSTAEILLPTTVILRMAEQFLELADDPQCHMQGAYSVFSAANSSYSPSRIDVQGVSFWIGVRECLRICFLYERECQFDIEIVDTSDLLGQASDEVWTNRMTYHLARLCNICWGAANKPRFEHELETIAADIDRWRQHLPDGFKPWYYQDNVSDIFPIIKYYSTWHAIGWQQYYAARTMIGVYRTKQSLGDNSGTIQEFVNSKTLLVARLCCAVVFSCDEIGTGINGSHLACWTGRLFTGRREQQIISEWLSEFMRRTKWPNQTCLERLAHDWGISTKKTIGPQSPPYV
ncbi:hypothetical protein PV05_10673 [Exophiala xenobiotica]|uniref:Transcription factor domain-containing protein n=1 Tax=Exophiala xenobiotica TaxID=348802 RepID=A0A0D2BIA2_9EURO|nr:uncharacterized protein PV05_10673 [Exophiala xenobiotica]KIW52011.1 hypothetical protein PV05_10673 [Exophiala xenobiotica]